jgi:tetratricopeptide (TPR) repeat protein
VQDQPVLEKGTSQPRAAGRPATKQEAEEFLQAVERQIRYAEPLAILREGQRDAAARAFEALLKKDPKDFRAAHHLAVLHHGWAMELEEDGGAASASTHWRKGLAHWHQVWQADGFWEALSVKGASLGRDFKAETVQRLRDDLPGRLLGLHAAYVTYWLEAGETTRAKQHLELILKSPFPDKVRQAVREELTRPYLEEADRLRERAQFEEAVQELELLLSVDEQHAEARKKAGDVYNIYGVKLHAERKLGEAKRCFQRALHFDPTHEAAQGNLGRIEYELMSVVLGRWM